VKTQSKPPRATQQTNAVNVLSNAYPSPQQQRDSNIVGQQAGQRLPVLHRKQGLENEVNAAHCDRKCRKAPDKILIIHTREITASLGVVKPSVVTLYGSSP
jgi:hypothetical protein